MIRASMIFVLCFLLSCHKQKDKEFVVEIDMINGRTYTESFLVPEDSFLYIRTDRGSYRLCWEHKNTYWGANPSGNTVKAGVVNYRYIKR